MAQLLGSPLFTALDADGNPISGATLNFYLTTTTTAADVYHDSGQTTPWVQPITCDSAGRAPDIYMPTTVTLKLVIKDAGGVTIRTIDPANNSVGSVSTGFNITTDATALTTGSSTSSGDDASILIKRNLVSQGSSGSHGVRDETAINIAGGTSPLYAYAAFDAIPIMSGGGSPNQHLRAFQARVNYTSGNALVNGIDGLNVNHTIGGAGAVGFTSGVNIRNNIGAGLANVAVQYGVYIDALSGAGANYPIWSNARGLAYFAGSIQSSLGMVSAPVLTANTATTEALRIQNTDLGGHTLTTQYGIHIDALSGASANYAVQVDGNNLSNFRGQVQTGHTFYSAFVADANEDAYGLHVGDATLNGHTIANSYGVYIDALTVGTNKFAIFSAGTSPSVLGGALTVGGTILPGTTNSFNLGSAGADWKDIFSQNALTVVSDRREKTDDPNPVNFGLPFILELTPRSFFRNGDPARHLGFYAQELKEASDLAGIENFAGHVLADPNDPESRQLIRETELIAALVKSVQQISDRLLAAGL